MGICAQEEGRGVARGNGEGEFMRFRVLISGKFDKFTHECKENWNFQSIVN